MSDNVCVGRLGWMGWSDNKEYPLCQRPIIQEISHSLLSVNKGPFVPQSPRTERHIPHHATETTANYNAKLRQRTSTVSLVAKAKPTLPLKRFWHEIGDQ